MVGKAETNEIRGLDIDKTVRGFADEQYVFKSLCNISPTSSDEIRWYQKTAGTLSPTSPQTLLSSRMATPTVLEPEFTRNVSYPKKWIVEHIISDEDIQGADIDVLATTLKDLTLAITSAVDAHVWDVMTESQSPSNIQTFATTAIGGDQWDAASYGADIVADLSYAEQLIRTQNYDVSDLYLAISPKDYSSIKNWLISGKGSSIPGFSSEKIRNGVVMELMGFKIIVSNNVTADYALAFAKGGTVFKQKTPISSNVEDEFGIGKRIRIVERGVAYVTDPKKHVLITDTQS